MNHPARKACGILFCYNEEHILAESVRHYLNQGIDLVLIDNDSSDSSVEIARSFQTDASSYRGRLIDIQRIETDGYEWRKILQFACQYMHENLSDYEWILTIDADSFYYSPAREMPLLTFMDHMKGYGYNVIDGIWYDFRPTEQDDPSKSSHAERMRFCKVEPWRVPQQKIFTYDPSIDFYTSWGHCCYRQKQRVAVIKFHYHHYPWVSLEHGRKKIFKERNPRYVDRKDHPHMHPGYGGKLPIETDLIENSRNLWLYDQEKTQMSPRRLQFLLRFRGVLEVFRRARLEAYRRGLADWRIHTQRFWKLFLISRIAALRLLRASIAGFFEYPSSAADTGPIDPEAPTRQLIPLGEALRQPPFNAYYPHIYHFLVTNFCNVRCVFCNQYFDEDQKQSIDLDRFKTMLSHLPTDIAGTTFHFSGGGDPLLCQDLFKITQHVSSQYPWINISIRSNGLLIEKYASGLALSGINQAEISVHGSTQESNNLVLQNQGSGDVFEGIRQLNQHLSKHQSQMRKTFCMAVSRTNIQELPGLIEMASELNVEEVSVFFWRYYPGKFDPNHNGGVLNQEDSLFYHQDLYDEVIRRSKGLSESLNVCLVHEPAFGSKVKNKPCIQPWNTIVVDWEGTVYPCTGGEVWFRDQVRSGQYHFGNLLRDDLHQFWNNESFTMTRRTCNPQLKEDLVPECSDCHNTICLRGPAHKVGHILRNPN